MNKPEKKQSNLDIAARDVATGFGFFLLPFIAIFVAIIFYQQFFTTGGQKFSKTAWQPSTHNNADTAALSSVRCKMFKDLEKHHLKKGMNRTGVREILGIPSPIYSTAGHDYYPIGSCGIIYYELRIFYDGDDRILKTKIYED